MIGYTKEEIPGRVCVWFMGNGMALILQSFISYGIGKKVASSWL